MYELPMIEDARKLYSWGGIGRFLPCYQNGKWFVMDKNNFHLLSEEYSSKEAMHQAFIRLTNNQYD